MRSNKLPSKIDSCGGVVVAMSKPRRRISRTNHKGRSDNPVRFIRLNHNLLRSDAYCALTPQERAVLIEVMRHHNGSNNGRIGLSSRQAAEACNINKDTACRVFRRLVELGFLKQSSEGSFDYKVCHSPTWEVTEFGVGGRSPTKDYLIWSPEKISVPVEGTDCPSISDTLSGFRGHPSQK